MIDLVSDDGSDDGDSSVVILEGAAVQNGGVVVVGEVGLVGKKDAAEVVTDGVRAIFVFLYVL